MIIPIIHLGGRITLLGNFQIHDNGTVKNFLPNGDVETLTLNEVLENRLRPDERHRIETLAETVKGADLPISYPEGGNVWSLFRGLSWNG
jgi:hypothetical protein